MDIKTKKLTIIVVCLLALGFVCYVVSNALPSWTTMSINQIETTVGLWKLCGSASGVKVCVTFDCNQFIDSSICMKRSVSQAFMTLACVISAISSVCFIVSLKTADRPRSLILIAGKGLAFGCFAIGIIGIVIGIETLTNDLFGQRIELGPGSIMGLAALIVNLFGAILSILIK